MAGISKHSWPTMLCHVGSEGTRYGDFRCEGPNLGTARSGVLLLNLGLAHLDGAT